MGVCFLMLMEATWHVFVCIYFMSKIELFLPFLHSSTI
jgi:hypothetical protein